MCDCVPFKKMKKIVKKNPQAAALFRSKMDWEAVSTRTHTLQTHRHIHTHTDHRRNKANNETPKAHKTHKTHTLL